MVASFAMSPSRTGSPLSSQPVRSPFSPGLAADDTAMADKADRSPLGSSSKRTPQTVARNCVCDGEGLMTAMTRMLTSFTIEARDAEGTKQSSGGDKFKVEVRGSATARAKVTDREDGTYLVEYKPSTSGVYSISITLNGVPLPESPYRLEVLTPAPDPVRCLLSGGALTRARAREIATFEVEFVDALGQIARAEELDVWVERVERRRRRSSGLLGQLGEFVDELAERGINEAEKLTGMDLDGDGDVGLAGSPASTQATEKHTATGDVDGAAAVTPHEQGDHGLGGGNSSGPLSRATYRQLMSFEALKQTGGRVEVGSKPLIMRADSGLESTMVTMLRPGQMVKVLEEIEVGDDRARASPLSHDDDLSTPRTMHNARLECLAPPHPTRHARCPD